MRNWLQKWRRRRRPQGDKSIDWLREYLPECRTVLEAGAHNGSDSLRFSTIWPGVRVHAFEPVTSLYRELQQRAEQDPNIHTYPSALGSHTGQIQIHVSSGRSDASSSLLVPKEHLQVHPDVHFTETQLVDCITIDDWAGQNQIGQIDFMWLDLQGYELAALRNGQSLLPGCRAIFTEVNLVENYAGAPLYSELRAWLEAQGFLLAKELIFHADGGNVLFVKGETC